MPSAHTYCGLLDDFAAHHRQCAIQSVSDLNRYLVEAVLFSDWVLINDGYVLLNEAVRQAVIKPKSSPLRNLVEVGYVRILSRTKGGLADIPAEMKRRGIDSATEFMATAEYETYQPELERWDSKLQSAAYNWRRAWSAEFNTTGVFNAIGRDALQESIESEKDLSKELQLFERELEGIANRTAWERTADRLKAEDRLSDAGYASLMSTANEAYQYHWGCILESDEEPVRVQTQLPRYLRSLDRSFEVTSEIDPKPIRFELNVDFARKATGERWKLLADVGHWGNPVLQQKEVFRDALLSYYRGDGVKREQAENEAKKYGKVLSKHFGHPKLAAAGMTTVFVVAPVIAGVGAGIALAVGLAGVAADALHLNRPFERLVAPRSTKWVKKLDNAPVDSVASFELDAERARAYRAKAGPWTG